MALRPAVAVEQTYALCLPATTLADCGGQAHLRWLVRRIADNDHDALREVVDRLSASLTIMLSRPVSDPDRVARIVAGTFIEVWWLAGGHVDPGTDVLAWITDIVNRRFEASRPPPVS